MRHILAFVVDTGPVFLVFGLLRDNRKLRYLLPKNAQIRICFSPLLPPGAHSVAVKQLNARGFRLLSHIPEFVVDVGSLLHFSSEKDRGGVHPKQKIYDATCVPAHCCLSGQVPTP